MTITMLANRWYRCGGETNRSATVAQWPIRWAAIVLSKFAVGADCKTDYDMLTGRLCNLEVLPIGETVLSEKAGEKASGWDITEDVVMR